MTIRHRLIEYRDGDTVLEGRLSWDDSATGQQPGILVSHTIAGRAALEENKADKLAELGYVAFALDLYGKGVRGETPAENRALMDAQLANRAAMQERLLLALSTLKAQPEVDADKIGAIGFCFGGLCVLDIAKTWPEWSASTACFIRPQIRVAIRSRPKCSCCMAGMTRWQRLVM